MPVVLVVKEKVIVSDSAWLHMLLLNMLMLQPKRLSHPKVFRGKFQTNEDYERKLGGYIWVYQWQLFMS